MTLAANWFTVADLTCDNANTEGASGYAAAAQSWLYAKTGYRWPGVTQSVVSPTYPCGHDRGQHCTCRVRWQRLDLTRWVRGPIVSVDEVVVDGAVVPDDQYRLDNRRFLAAQYDGPGGTGTLLPWPVQNLTLPPGAVGTWQVTVTHGSAPPPEVLAAAKALACQLIAKHNGGPCDLPDNATSVTRDGVTITLQVPEDGRTGIPWIDSVLDLYPPVQTRRLLDPAAERAPVRRL